MTGLTESAMYREVPKRKLVSSSFHPNWSYLRSNLCAPFHLSTESRTNFLNRSGECTITPWPAISLRPDAEKNVFADMMIDCTGSLGSASFIERLKPPATSPVCTASR